MRTSLHFVWSILGTPTAIRVTSRTLPQMQSPLAPNVGLDPPTALHKTTPTTTRLGETQPSSATADPVVVVSSDVEKQSNTVDKLVQLFVEKEGYGPKHLTRKQRAQMKQLVLA